MADRPVGSVTARIAPWQGTYPSVATVISTSGGPLTVTVPQAALAAAVTKAAAITTAAADKRTPARVVVGPDGITIEPGSSAGRACTAPAVPAQVEHHTQTWVAGVNPAFFVDAVNSFDVDEVTLHLGDPARPMVLTAAGELNESTAAFKRPHAGPLRPLTHWFAWPGVTRPRPGAARWP